MSLFPCMSLVGWGNGMVVKSTARSSEDSGSVPILRLWHLTINAEHNRVCFRHIPPLKPVSSTCHQLGTEETEP